MVSYYVFLKTEYLPGDDLLKFKIFGVMKP